jgi:hypothetical protein
MEKLNQNTYWCRMPYQLMQDDRLTAADALVYATLLDYCTDSFMCSVGKTDLSAATGLTTRTLFHCLDRLEACGYLERVKTAGVKNTYKLADIIGLKRQRRTITQSRRTEEPEQETKQRYGEYQNVLLTVAEFDKLVSDFGTAKANNYVQKCDSYCQSTGKCYADYDATIRRWIDSDVKKSLPEDDVKRQEFSEIDEYLELVNRFDD